MPSPEDLLDDDACAQARAVRERHVSAGELVRAAVARAEARNPALNAIIHHRFEAAVAEADALDAGEVDERLGDRSDAPFRGVPLLLKDALGAMEGEPYHLGMRALKDAGAVADHDSELVRRFRAAGFVVLGHTNTPELALSVTTEPVAYGATRNPWAPEFSPGGSSGGSAAAVSAGIVAAAHGNDMGGSIRTPASHCGLFGMKPSYGRTTLGPDFGEYWGQMSHEHVLCRTVRDSAAILDATHGPMGGDPTVAPAPVRPFAAEVAAGRAGATGALEIAVRRHPPFGIGVSSPEVLEALDRTVAVLEGLGHRVVEPSPGPLDEAEGSPLEAMTVPVHVASELDRIGAALGRTLGEDDVEAWTWALAQAGRTVSASDLVLQHHGVHRFRREVEAWRAAAGHDLLLTPTTAGPPPRLGVGGGANDFVEVLQVCGVGAAFTQVWNIAGWPAASVPAGTCDVDGAALPIGSMLVAPWGREDLLYRVCAQVEQAAPWPLLAPVG